MGKRLGIVGILIASASACGGPPASLAASSMACDKGPLETQDFPASESTGRYAIVKGCGRVDVLIRETDDDSWTSLRKSASLDLSCDTQSLTVTVASQTKFVVDGCHQQATYEWIAGMFNMSVNKSMGSPRP
jgi:hypothetical protein